MSLFNGIYSEGRNNIIIVPALVFAVSVLLCQVLSGVRPSQSYVH